MNRWQRMKNRETARQLRQRVNAGAWWRGATISVGVDAGAPGGDVSAIAWVELGRVVRVHPVSVDPVALDLRRPLALSINGGAP